MIVIPIFLIFLYSITLNEDGNPVNFTITLSHYKEFFQPHNINILNKSLSLALQTTLICLLLGYPAAWFVSQLDKNKQNTVILLMILPMWINMLLRTYAWQIILGRGGPLARFINFFGFSHDGLLYTDTAVLIGMVYSFLPFMILPIYTALIRIDKNYISAARDLGANTAQTFMKVIFPLSLPGVITGIILVFLPSISTFTIPRLLGGGDYQLIGNLIERQFLQNGNWSFGSAISMILMIMILLSLAFMRKTDSKTKGGALPW